MLRRSPDTNRISRGIPRCAAAALGLGVAFLLSACESPISKAYGLSQRAHVAQSVENPDAGIDSAQGPRQDGVSTENAMSQRRQSEQRTQEEVPESVINIDIGG